MLFLESLGIFGWNRLQENLLLSSILTGDPLLMIGKHGSAKTAVAFAISKALGSRFISYDASKAMFDDVLGYPNPGKLSHGEIEYVQSPLTIWDKEFILIDEINRPVYEMQSKWLEIIRSRRIMGFPTDVRWVWAAMNPACYAATKELDDALIGRFAYFLYVPEFMDMDEGHRVSITQHINGDDAPAMSHWKRDFKKVSKKAGKTENLHEIMEKAAIIFDSLRGESKLFAEFISKYAELLKRDTRQKLIIDGRRAGFIQRAIIASKAISLARGEEVEDNFDLVKHAVMSSLPLGLNSDAGRDADLENTANNTLGFFSDMFKGDIDKLYDIYEMLTTKDIIKKLRLMLRTDLNELARISSWQEILAISEPAEGVNPQQPFIPGGAIGQNRATKKKDKISKHDKDDIAASKDKISLMAYCALSIEAAKPGSVPTEMLTRLGERIDLKTFDTTQFPPLLDLNVQYAHVLSGLVARDNPVESLIACGIVRDFIVTLNADCSDSQDVKDQMEISQIQIDALKKRIDSEIASFYGLIKECAADESLEVIS